MKNLFLLGLLSMSLVGFKDGTLSKSNAALKNRRSIIPSNQALGFYYPNQRVCTSNNGQFYLAYQGDGNLVLYTSTNKALWSSVPVINNPRYVNFDNVGNVFEVNQNNQVYWNANINLPALSSFYWVLQDDGNFVLYYTSACCTGSLSTGTAGGAKSHHFGSFR